MLARAEDRPACGCARRWPEQPRPGLALVARHRGVAEIHAARALEQIARGGRHVAQLRGCAGENRLRQHGVIALYGRVIREIGIANGRADLQPAVRRRFDLVERQAIDVDDAGSGVSTLSFIKSMSVVPPARKRTSAPCCAVFDFARGCDGGVGIFGRMNSNVCMMASAPRRVAVDALLQAALLRTC